MRDRATIERGWGSIACGLVIDQSGQLQPARHTHCPSQLRTSHTLAHCLVGVANHTPFTNLPNLPILSRHTYIFDQTFQPPRITTICLCLVCLSLPCLGGLTLAAAMPGMVQETCTDWDTRVGAALETALATSLGNSSTHCCSLFPPPYCLSLHLPSSSFSRCCSQCCSRCCRFCSC